MTTPARQPLAGIQEGEILDGKYRIERILGVGGMGMVVAARHLQLDERVAIKFLLPGLLADADAVGRFLREARAAVKIRSDHVARVLDVGTSPAGGPYIVMEYLEGGDLAARLKRHGPLPVEEAVDFVLQACVALADAHGIGIVHRDLKPANLFCLLRTDGQLVIKVLDFGISKVSGATGPDAGMSLTSTTSVMGSPLYMSPEQMRSARDVDRRTDIWALGIVLFELLTGRPPFLGDTLPDVAIKVATEPPPSVQSLRADVPAGLEAVILRCLQKSPGTRYQDVGELAVALSSFGSSRAKVSVDRISGILAPRGAPGTATGTLSSSQPPVESTMLAPGTLLPVGRTGRGAAGGTKMAATLAVLGGFGLIAGSILLAHRSASGPEEIGAHEATGVLGPPANAARTELPPSSTTMAATVDASPSAATPPMPPGPEGPPAVTQSAGTASAPHPPPSSSQQFPTHPFPTSLSVVAKPIVDCSNPFTIDQRGHHVPKPECL
jgi:serine/threonine-protein kinase